MTLNTIADRYKKEPLIESYHDHILLAIRHFATDVLAGNAETLFYTTHKDSTISVGCYLSNSPSSKTVSDKATFPSQFLPCVNNIDGVPCISILDKLVEHIEFVDTSEQKSVHWLPSKSIYGNAFVRPELILPRLHQICCLIPELKIGYYDEYRDISLDVSSTGLDEYLVGHGLWDTYWNPLSPYIAVRYSDENIDITMRFKFARAYTNNPSKSIYYNFDKQEYSSEFIISNIYKALSRYCTVNGIIDYETNLETYNIFIYSVISILSTQGPSSIDISQYISDSIFQATYDWCNKNPKAANLIIERIFIDTKQINSQNFYRYICKGQIEDELKALYPTRESMFICKDNRKRIRHRTAMYIGSTDKHCQMSLFREISAMFIDAAYIGETSKVDIQINSDHSISCRYDCKKIPVNNTGYSGYTTVENLALSHEDKNKHPKVKCLAGLEVVKNLSERFEIMAINNGMRYRCIYKKGLPILPIEITKCENKSDISINWRLDTDILIDDIEEMYPMLDKFLRIVSYGLPEVTILLTDNFGGDKPKKYHTDNGAEDLLLLEIGDINKISSPLTNFEKLTINDLPVVVMFSLLFHLETSGRILSLVNHRHMTDGGDHHTAIQYAITRELNDFGIMQGVIKRKLSGDNYKKLYTSTIFLRLINPRFMRSTMSYLSAPYIKPALTKIVRKLVKDWCIAHPEQATTVINSATEL